MRIRFLATALIVGAVVFGAVPQLQAAPAVRVVVPPALRATPQPVFWARDPYGRRIWVPGPYYRRRFYGPPVGYYHPWHRRWVDRWGRWH